MANRIAGWIPYGSDDGSVIWNHPLTTPLSASDLQSLWSTFSINGSGQPPTHDAVLGMKAVDAAGAEAGYRFQTQAAALDVLDFGGQITFQAQRYYVCYNDPDNGSAGYGPSTQKTSVSALATSGSVMTLGSKTTGGGFLSSVSAGSTANGGRDWVRDSSVTPNGVTHSEGKPDFITVHIGWWGGRVGGLVLMAVDGLVIGAGTRGSATLSKLVNNFYIGSDRGTANTFNTAYFIRHLQIATRPPGMPVHPRMRSLAVLSDSMTDNNNQTGPHRDVSADNVMRRYFNKMGFRPGAFNVSENPGYSVGPTSTQLETQVQTVLDFNPDVVVISGGTNDVIDGALYGGADFTTEYHDLIEQLFFGVAKTSRTPLQQLFCNIPAPHFPCVSDATKAANHVDVTARIRALPAWWDTTYGASWGTGRVHVIDVFTALGANHRLMGEAAMSSDGTHFGHRGNRLYGECLARALHAAL
jgi:lysophospholipase L1-like esterase